MLPIAVGAGDPGISATGAPIPLVLACWFDGGLPESGISELGLERVMSGVVEANVGHNRGTGVPDPGDSRHQIPKDTDTCIKARQSQTSTHGSTDFRDHWYWESDPFDTGAA